MKYLCSKNRHTQEAIKAKCHVRLKTWLKLFENLPGVQCLVRTAVNSNSHTRTAHTDHFPAEPMSAVSCFDFSFPYMPRGFLQKQQEETDWKPLIHAHLENHR